MGNVRSKVVREELAPADSEKKLRRKSRAKRMSVIPELREKSLVNLKQVPSDSETEVEGESPAIPDTPATTRPKKVIPAGLPQIRPAILPSGDYMQQFSSVPIAPYYWGDSNYDQWAQVLPRHTGHVETGNLIGDGSYERIKDLVTEAIESLDRIYGSIDKPDTPSHLGLVTLTMSEDLAQWKREQHKIGRILPAKGFGRQRTSDEVIRLLGAENWPAPMQTNNSVFGVCWSNLAIGGYDEAVLYSNFCCDLAFYYEHGFNKIFPEFEEALLQAGIDEPHARSTFAGAERRDAAKLGIQYIRHKVALETKHIAALAGKTARVTRRDAQVICFCESSLIGMAAEAMTRGYQPGAVMADMVFSNPATDVVDVGSDLHNSEVMNSFLNTADVIESGVVTEDILRRVYDAYAFTCARILTERWTEPTGCMTSQLYPWHMRDDRHFFLRRAVLGYSKARRTKPDQREGDMDEVFDEQYHTTGFSRPLKNACNGEDTCDHVKRVCEGHPTAPGLLARLWHEMVIAPLEYVRAGVVDADYEEEMGVKMGETKALCWHDGLINEVNWMVCHASQHSWQVNFLMEAAMFGSFLDAGTLVGKLDRAD